MLLQVLVAIFCSTNAIFRAQYKSMLPFCRGGEGVCVFPSIACCCQKLQIESIFPTDSILIFRLWKKSSETDHTFVRNYNRFVTIRQLEVVVLDQQQQSQQQQHLLQPLILLLQNYITNKHNNYNIINNNNNTAHNINNS